MNLNEIIRKAAEMDGEKAGVQEYWRTLLNYDEAKVSYSSVPSPLINRDGTRITTVAEWENFRRKEIIESYKKLMYGELPGPPDEMDFEILNTKTNALDDTAIRKEIRITMRMKNGRQHHALMLLYLPKHVQTPVPAFFGLNFKGNHTVTDEKDVLMTGSQNNLKDFLKEDMRGCHSHRFCFKDVIAHGYASATICYHDFFPDHPNGWRESIFQLFDDVTSHYGVHEKYSAIGAWSWGMSRAVDYLQRLPEINPGKIALHGLSRIGKAALWSGANDERCQIIISNESGCGGAKLGRRYFGEIYLTLIYAQPHWFIRPFRYFPGKEEELPFDQHFLLALTAPRILAVGSAEEDLWADPKGEFLSAGLTRDVYQLYGIEIPEYKEMPEAGTALVAPVSYHIRHGKHDQNKDDWDVYLMIADRYLQTEWGIIMNKKQG